MSFILGWYWIPGVMLGVEIGKDEEDTPMLIFDLFILRLMFGAKRIDD